VPSEVAEPSIIWIVFS